MSSRAKRIRSPRAYRAPAPPGPAASLLAALASAAIDVLAVPDHVTRANQTRAEAAESTDEARARSGAELTLYPLVSADGRDGGVGLGASLRF